MTDPREMDDKEFADLQASVAVEAQRRAEIRVAAERQRRLLKNARLFDNKGVLLSLMEHGRTSCSDENPVNGYFNEHGVPRCNKCALIKLESYSLGDVEITVDISVREDL